MCCQPGRHHGFQAVEHQNNCLCGCEGPWMLRPRFMSKNQKIARMKEHLDSLREEVKAVEEHIAQTKKEN